MCQNIWRSEIPPELKGLEKLQEAISLLPCYDLQPMHHQDEGKPLWTSVVYDYRKMTHVEIQKLGLPKNM